MHRISTDVLIAVLAIAGLSACTTSKEKLLPHDETTMLDIWNQETGGGNSTLGGRRLLDARQVLKRSLADDAVAKSGMSYAPYTRDAANEIYRQFERLPNPDLVMYVFPHLAGDEPTPVPGYTTVFPFYQRVQYAMPGERTEDY
jgi:conjugative transfer region lipoprotein (TIGR03751 family)